MALGVSLLAVFATAAKCPPPSTWSGSADEVIQRAPATDDILRGSTDLGSLGTQVDDVLRAAPKSGADRAKIDALASMKRGLEEIQEVQQAADADRTIVQSQAQAAADTVRTGQSVKEKLAEAAHDILKDVACDVAFSAMTKAEKQGSPRPKFSDAGEPTVEAIVDYAARLLAGRFGPDALTGAQWTQYGKSVYTKVIQKGDTNGDKILNGGEQLELPSWTGSRAFVYYARFCLAPPRK
ncbi:hypothetical protein GCM10011609_09200 [Lentzea pudingi]|uniref:Uncharacterized protein n=1 Tax=Lentzea pudingi TaxID=1789439 RepID=A0ABQ2HC67_9PSEU|nr:hypothetical protein GCM10011609_09200 [Lentzea pudingi]